MINKFQRILYILGTLSPYIMISSVCFGVRVAYTVYGKWFDEWNIINRDVTVNVRQSISVIASSIPVYLWVLFFLSVFLLGYHIFFVRAALRRLPRMDFHASQTPEENDEFAKGLGAVYFIPVIEWLLTANIFDVGEYASGCFLLGMGCLVFLISLFANKSYGSPVYWMMGYHFHRIQAEGSKPYILMSRRKNFRNKDQVKAVIRLFEDLLIDDSQT